MTNLYEIQIFLNSLYIMQLMNSNTEFGGIPTEVMKYDRKLLNGR
jgi:hypothetical protein